jgi:hypothetical protein
MPAPSLKVFLPSLATILRVPPGSLYERQRVLVAADMLETEGWRGPGRGVRLSHRSVALILISVLASDQVIGSAEPTKETARLKPFEGKCPLTGTTTFVDAFTTVLGTRDLLDRVSNVHVARFASHAAIVYRDTPEHTDEHLSPFISKRGLVLPGVEIDARIRWHILDAIANAYEAAL